VTREDIGLTRTDAESEARDLVFRISRPFRVTFD
jgi:hypothetical protein